MTLKKVLVILFVSFQLTSISQKHYSKPRVINKGYFSCYNTPFHRFNSEISDFVWFSGLYDGDTLLSNYKVEILYLDTLGKLKFSFFEDSVLKIESYFNVVSKTKNEIRLKLNSNDWDEYLNCSKNIGYYSYIESETSELYYEVDNQRFLIMTFEKI